MSRMRFRDSIKASLQDDPPNQKWFYVSMRSKDGKFHSALVAPSENFITAMSAATKLLAPNDEAKLSNYAEIPNEDLPPEEYRNRRLSREEVEKLWPQNRRV